MSQHPDLAAMVGLFAYNPPAILQALKQADKLGKIKVIGFDEADETLQGIVDGTLHPFDGPIVNQAGEQVIGAGERLDDGVLLGMDWYVEGVQGELGQ